MALFRRESDAPTVVDAPDPSDDPAALRQTVLRANRFVNQYSGRLPGEAVVAIRKLTDTLREIIDTSQVRELDIHAVLSVKGMLNDYLPTTVKTYLALDRSQLDAARPSGRTPTDSLLDQLDSLQTAADTILVAARAQDADALMTQGNFLRTKYSGSDLDL